jgi:hypothetical protein
VPLPFDRIALVSAVGERQLSVAEFCALPLAERLGAVLERRVSFYMGSVPVDARDALKALRERAA